jgi:hypothetical protein
MRVVTSETGPRQLRFRIAREAGELIADNNARDALVTVTDRAEKILYVEGEPRFELKFMRRAVRDDQNLRLVALQRTAENKFLRLGVEDSLELVAGFPKTREELTHTTFVVSKEAGLWLIRYQHISDERARATQH